MDQFVKLLSLLRQDDNYYELMAKRKVKEQVKEYADLFERLALCSGSVAADGYHPARDVMTQQFKGMAKSLNKIATDLSTEHQPLRVMKKRYDLQIATATYAKEGKISGDSCLCTPIDNVNFLIALSDGMGQGLRAAERAISP